MIGSRRRADPLGQHRWSMHGHLVRDPAVQGPRLTAGLFEHCGKEFYHGT
jgi:hypothetical protein